MSQPGRLRVRQVGHAAIIDLEGDLTHLTEGPLMAALHSSPANSRRVVLLNFEHVGYINSAGISVLIGLIAEVRQAKRTLLACNLSTHYRKIFHMVGLDTFLHVFETESDALAAHHHGED